MEAEERTYTIYKHSSPSGKVYIGQTATKVWIRWLHNGNGYKSCVKFWNAIKKYGWENFTHEIILEGISKSEANYAEKYLIKWYKMHNMSYNITDGGEGFLGVPPWNKGTKGLIKSWNKGMPMLEETKAKISKAKKGHKLGPQSSTHIQKKVEKHVIPIVMVNPDNPNEWRYFKSAKEAEDKFGFNRKVICACLKNKCVQAYGAFWFYDAEFTQDNFTAKELALKKAKIHYKHPVCPDYINKDGINIINCLKPKAD